VVPPQKLKLTDPMKQTLEPTVPVFREFAFGGDEDGGQTIDSLNQSVRARITTPELAVWKNYMLIGAMWLNNPAYFREDVNFTELDRADPSKKIIGGDKRLSNSTIETFTQHADNQGYGKFCFDCHNTKAVKEFPPKRLGVSHVLTNVYNHAVEAKGLPGASDQPR
jgi:hypothetical protein